MTGVINKESVRVDENLSLLRMTPQYDPQRHRTYAQALFDACNPKNGLRPHNVALMGSYGTGKSSIIKGFEDAVRRDYRRRHWLWRLGKRDGGTSVPEYIKVTSLLLCPESETTSENAYPVSEIHDTDETRDDSDGQPIAVHRTETIRKPADDFATEEIQKEIIKQLIYSIRPSDVNRSHFRRLRSRHVPSEYVKPIVLTTLISILVAVLGDIMTNQLSVSAFLSQFASLSRLLANPWTLICGVLIIVGIVVAVLFIDELQTFTIQATVADSVSLSYDERRTIDIFDKYVDEIVYLLEKERIRYVVFEDLDRATDWDIYYELRELNTLINASTQTHGQTVTFIYVMGDAAMDLNAYDPASREWKQCNGDMSPAVVAERKSKFFEVSVYVRPFITAGNANAVFREMLGRDAVASGEAVLMHNEEDDDGQ